MKSLKKNQMKQKIDSRMQRSSFHNDTAPGKIYSAKQIKREPLSDLSHYQKSIMINDNINDFYLNSIVSRKSSTKKKQKVIKFIGNQQENVNQIINGLYQLHLNDHNLTNEAEKIIVKHELSEILNIFYNKISKIRKQRDFYKQNLQEHTKIKEKEQRILSEELDQIKQTMHCLQKEKQSLIKRLQIVEQQKQFFQKENYLLKEKVKIATLNSTGICEIYSDNQNQIKNQQFLLSFEDENLDTKKQVNNKNKIKKQYKQTFYSQNMIPSYQKQKQLQQLQVLLRKFNLQPNHLQKIVEQYLNELQQYHGIQFQNQQQKRLYFLAKKMETKIWNMKVKKDIEKLTTLKQSAQSSLNRSKRLII